MKTPVDMANIAKEMITCGTVATPFANCEGIINADV